MKNFKFLSLIVAASIIFTFTQCSDDDDNSSSNLPENAETFLASTYPNATYEVKTRKGPDGSEEIYVELNNGAKISFTKTGNIVYVGGKIDIVPESVITDKVKAYVTENYPTASIVEWELDDNEQEVELSNNIELVFDLDGNFLYSDNDSDDENEETLTYAELLENIKSFIETHFSDVSVKEITKETNGSYVKYEIEMFNDIEMDFDANGELTSIEVDAGIPTAIISENISSYVSENYPDATIVEWDLDRRKQEIELDNDVELVFDLDGNFLYKD
ncbi:hypothetical protein EGM88_00705 [Aureibaculum marinum]|uniref:Putative beta-lactamase-inhibitor-like PepSY-like domain-containing protein n=1 Tax=Aureibaculum marinum TaxID=2487930 RepID=A0A3N4P893_9FLAO|nr:PepSY-like domain-containing protein [Aureibaculum marinum]RPE00901.1 hypothetical protein EGM88_00705 [Aureibaculum marinum]